MKKIKYFLGLSLTVMLLTSCFEKVENWHSNTFEYDGRYAVGMVCEEDEDYNVDIKYGYDVFICNSAANISNEIIVDTRVAIYIEEKMDGDFEDPQLIEEGVQVRGKFKITGDPSSFKGQGSVWNNYCSEDLVDGEYYLIIGGHYYNPSDLEDDDAGEEFDAIHLYSRLSMEECKITPNGAKTIGSNTSDGFDLKITTYCDYLIVESFPTPTDTWADPNTPEYGWRVKKDSRRNADDWEEHYIMKGYRYTGYPEDNPNIKPPIIVK
jgi:hypothetical protein